MHFFITVICSTIGIVSVTSSRPSTKSLIQYDVHEEQPVGTIVGDVSQHHRASSNATADLRYFFSPNTHRYLIIDAMTGIVRTAIVIDRETLCAFDEECSLPAVNVVVQGPDQGPGRRNTNLYKLIVHVRDVNDHTPEFPSSVASLNVSETAKPGTRLSVLAAEDMDSGIYRVLNYELEPVRIRQTFDVNFTEQPDGTQQVSLVLRERLDRELTAQYQFQLIARDGGRPAKSASLEVTVNVLDDNDNRPTFVYRNASSSSTTIYEATVAENVPLGTEVLRIEAVDADEGLNAQIVYGFAVTTGRSRDKQVLAIDQHTGVVSVVGMIDREVTSQVQLTVVATDSATIPLSAKTQLVVRVLDVNDNVPVVAVHDLVHVIENAQRETLVGHVTATDADLANNAQVTCHIDDIISRQHFKLVSVQQESNVARYQLVTIGTAIFDRELVPVYRLNVICHDGGLPRQSSSVLINVTVDDVNDNSPQLSESHYVITVSENSHLVYSNISATDPDIGPNATITFSIVPVLRSDAINDVFMIDKSTGELTSLVNFDYETQFVYRFYVVARDLGIPSMSSSSLVEVYVMDYNDERPIFTATQYVFEVMENQSSETVIGVVKAIDRDLDPANAVVEYKVLSVEPEDASDLIDVDRHSGQLKVKRLIDYELIKSFKLHLVAIDTATSEPLSELPMGSHCDVIVKVVDANDNCPRLSFPSSTNRSFITTLNDSSVVTAVGEVVAVVRLVANDIDSQSQLRFAIVDVVSDEFTVHIDDVTGWLTIVAVNLDRDRLLYALSLNVSASDDGHLLCSTVTERLDIVIHVKKHLLPVLVHLSSNTGVLVIAAGIAIGLIGVCVIIAGLLLLTRSCCKHQQNTKNTYNCRLNEVFRTPPPSKTKSATAASGKQKKGVTFDLGGKVQENNSAVEDFHGGWANTLQISSPLQHSIDYCQVTDCVLHQFHGCRRHSTSTDPATLNAKNVRSVDICDNDVWTFPTTRHTGSQLLLQRNLPFNTLPKPSTAASTACKTCAHDNHAPASPINKQLMPMIRWSATSLTDSGRGNSESDDVTALYLRLVPDLSTPSTPTTIESHV